MSDGMVLPSGVTVGEVRAMLADLNAGLDRLGEILDDAQRIVERALADEHSDGGVSGSGGVVVPVPLVESPFDAGDPLREAVDLVAEVDYVPPGAADLSAEVGSHVADLRPHVGQVAFDVTPDTEDRDEQRHSDTDDRRGHSSPGPWWGFEHATVGRLCAAGCGLSTGDARHGAGTRGVKS